MVLEQLGRSWGGYNLQEPPATSPLWTAPQQDKSAMFKGLHREGAIRIQRRMRLEEDGQELHEAASKLMDKLTASGFKSDKKSPLVGPMFTPPTANLQLASVATIARDPDFDSFFYNEKDKNNPLAQNFANNNRNAEHQPDSQAESRDSHHMIRRRRKRLYKNEEDQRRRSYGTGSDQRTAAEPCGNLDVLRNNQETRRDVTGDSRAVCFGVDDFNFTAMRQWRRKAPYCGI